MTLPRDVLPSFVSAPVRQAGCLCIRVLEKSVGHLRTDAGPGGNPAAPSLQGDARP